jgi:hypothetical protein
MDFKGGGRHHKQIFMGRWNTFNTENTEVTEKYQGNSIHS